MCVEPGEGAGDNQHGSLGAAQTPQNMSPTLTAAYLAITSP